MSVVVTITNGTIYEGSIFAIDPITESLVLKDNNTGAFTLISPTQIVKIDGDINNIPIPNINEFGLSVNELNQQETKAQEASKLCLEGINHNVSDKVQSIYDKMVFFYGAKFVKWNDNRIMVLDDYSIDPPYEMVTILPHAVNKVDQSFYNRLIHTLQNQKAIKR